jgi:hypothetical protein
MTVIGSAAAWAVGGSVLPILFGFLHAAGAVSDAFRPRHFMPTDRKVKDAMESTTIELVRRAGVRGPRPTVWDGWLGFNISHGLGVGGIGLFVALVALGGDLAALPWLLPVATIYAAMLLAVAIRFWFYGPVLIATSMVIGWGAAWVVSIRLP